MNKPYSQLTISQIFETANKSDTPVDVIKDNIKKDSRLVSILGFLANPRFKLDFPSGAPPYKMNEDDFAITEFDVLRLHDKLYVLYNFQTPKAKREQTFIQWLEQMCESESKVLIAIKDKSLVELYPNLTEYVIVDALGWNRDEYNKLK
jgi:hypothetical protein